MSAAALDGLTPAEKRRLLGEMLATRASVVRKLPVSFGQECILSIEAERPGTCLFSIPIVFRILGRLDVEALCAAFGEILRRHESLRTTFGRAGGAFVQCVAPSASETIRVEDVTWGPGVEPEAHVRELVQDRIRTPIDLAGGPVVRATLLRVGPEDHVLVLCMHRLVTDSWSLGILFFELKTLYSSFVDGKRTALSPLPLQYGDYVRWERAQVGAGSRERKEAFWQERLAGLRPISWPHGKESTSLDGDVCPVLIPGSVSEGVASLSKEAATTPFAVALAAYFTVLHRFTGERDLWTTTPAMANRDRSETESLIGLLGNLLILRVDVSVGLRFRELVGRVRDVAIEAMEHQDTSVLALARAGGTGAFAGLGLLGRVVFAYQTSRQPEFSLPGVELQLMHVHTGQTGSELALALFEWGGQTAAVVEYRRDLFSAATAGAFAQSFVDVLRVGTEHPEYTLAQLPVLPLAGPEAG